MTNYIGNKPTDIPLSASDIPDLPTSKITSGTFANSLISQSSVTQHVSATDLQPVKSDITALALREATNESSASFNLPNQHIDTFATDTLGTKTNVSLISSGYLASIVPEAERLYNTSSEPTYTGTYATSGGSSYWNGGALMRNDASNAESGVWRTSSAGSGTIKIDFGSVVTIDKFIFGFSRNAGVVRSMNVEISDSINSGYAGIDWTGYSTSSLYQDGSSNALSSATSGGRLNFNGGLSSSGHNNRLDITGFSQVSGRYIYFDVDQHDFHDANAHITEFRAYKSASNSATGTAIQNTNTVGSAKTEVGGTFLYKDNSGTATLGTDLKIYFTCNGGSNWTEASSYNAITPVYSTGIKQVRLGKTTCTSGTDVRYKVEWANQSSGSKETQLHGIGINY